ncbi:MAG: MFS transporter [Lachnospiraceae bacterium]|nr:MFS transporter [Lachnospiraceae bacterium]
MKQTKQTLWTAGFSRTTIATILNAIGGEAMNLPISLLVFDQTGSTLLSSLVLVCGILPDVLLPLLAAPFVDRGRKKTWIVGLDSATALFYLAMGLFVSRHAFHYPLYLAFVLIIGSISACCRLAYQAWYPSLIPAGLEQKGYAVSNTIYPFIAIAMSPVAAFLYKEISMAQIFYLVTLLTVLSVLVELGIPEAQTKECEQSRYTIRAYFEDVKKGLAYLKREKGIRNIYTYLCITQGCGDGTAILTQAYYQTMPGLTVTMLGFLRSAEMIGRFLGGLWQYQKEIPEKKRYHFTKFVYTVYNGMDLLLRFLSTSCRSSWAMDTLPPCRGTACPGWIL